MRVCQRERSSHLGRWFGEWAHPALPRAGIEDWARGPIALERPTAPPWPLILTRHGWQPQLAVSPSPMTTPLPSLSPNATSMPGGQPSYAGSD